MTTPDDDRRYEPYVRPVAPSVRRTAETWVWQDRSVHLEHVGDPEAPVRMLLVHGAGGNAAAMWPFAAHLSQAGAYVTVLDLPGYGRTRGKDTTITYADWRRVLVDAAARIDDGRPLVLLGASLGGMLALDTAASSGRGDLVIATCLLDVGRSEVRAALVRARWMARIALPAARLVVGPLRRLRVPVRWLAPMQAISNDPALRAEVLRDPRGGGGSMPLGWFRTLLESGPAVPPEEYAGPPVLLTHPACDRWTPTHISAQFLRRLPVRTRLVELEGCGHFPVEEPGFEQLLGTVVSEVRGLARDRRADPT
ncbi:alpha/beta hydrolase [Actinotalea ferrariae]|uniref:alpha/beta hydrolase n=1 Tax=Actinotalea ferrariae TaxID=1386098 RepID=UPI001C8BE5A2|nr:alpha/beta hydrolase [Actinotalea ferrariae]MBX9246677.1 alpha/beta hydrolase [Actinotalea ferrariae]